MTAVAKPLESNKFNNSDIRMHKPPVGHTDKDPATAQSLDVFERLFRSANKQKARLIVRVKENIAKKAKEASLPSPLDRKPADKAGNILRENKRLVNNPRSDETGAAAAGHHHETVGSNVSQVYLKDNRASSQRRFPCFKDKDLNICGDLSRKIVKVVSAPELGSRQRRGDRRRADHDRVSERLQAHRGQPGAAESRTTPKKR